MTDADSKLAVLENRLRECALEGEIAVAYSGGLDSRFLAHAALRGGLRVRALRVCGPHVPKRERVYAARWAEKSGIAPTVLDIDPLTLPELARNPKDRCYHCKKFMFQALRSAAGNLPLCDGTNASDSGEYRPGLKALAEAAVISPLAEAGLEKSDVRRLAAATGLDDPDQAAQPCLLTRFGYGFFMDASALARVDAAEDAVQEALAAFGLGAVPFRFRFETPELPALHVEAATLPLPLLQAFAESLAGAGFFGVPVRLVARLSGYFDRNG